ncbi:MAG: hypothetical protein P8Y94_02175 [Acidobacteriota bacterium]
MFFLLRRYWNGINRRARWLWIIFFPPLIYIVLVLANPQSFIVTQAVDVSSDSPVTRTPGSAEAISIKTLAEERFLFEDEQTYWTLRSRLDQEFPRESGAGIALWSLLHHDMNMRWTGTDQLELSYRGSDRSLGEFLVDFFVQRLLARTKEGRLVAASESAGRLASTGIRVDVPPAEVVGKVQTTEQRTLTGQGRAVALILVVSLCVVLFILGALELTDASFKSERQVARYLGVPVLGSLPDLDEVLEHLDQP